MDDHLRFMLKTHDGIVSDKGTECGPAMRLEALICPYINQQNGEITGQQFAKSNGWPIDIDFSKLTDRVILLTDSLTQLVFEDGLRSQNVVQQHFDQRLSGLRITRRKFSNLSKGKIPMVLADDSRPG
jgi:hypothetical protein